MSLKAAPAPKVRGVVQATYAQWEVILPGDERLFFDSRARFLFTQSRAALIARSTSGRAWRMPHTPAVAPQCFTQIQQILFSRGQCSHLNEDETAYCRDRTAPEADYGYCLRHKNQLLAACCYARCARRDAMELGGLFRPGMPGPATSWYVVPGQRRCCSFLS